MRVHNFGAKWVSIWDLGPYFYEQRSQKIMGFNCFNDWSWKGDSQQDHTSRDRISH